MIIEMEIHPILREKISYPEKNPARDNWDLPEGTHIGRLLEMLNLTEIPTILILNGHQGDKNSILNEGDILKIFAVLSGG